MEIEPLSVYLIVKEDDDSFIIKQITDMTSVPSDYLLKLNQRTGDVIILSPPLNKREYFLFLLGKFTALTEASVKQIVELSFKSSNFLTRSVFALTSLVIICILFQDYLPVVTKAVSNTALNKKMIAFIKNIFI